MPSYRTSTVIARPVAEVFAYLANVSDWSEWMSVEGVHPIDEGPPRVGLRAEGRMREGQRIDAFSVEVTAFEPGRVIGFKTTSGPVDWSGAWDVRSLDPGRTEVTATGDIRLRGLRRLLEPIMSGEIRKSEAAELVRLRTRLEEGSRG